MPTLTVTLADADAARAIDQARAAGFETVEDYLRDLLKSDAEAREDLIRALEEGERSGLSDETVESIYARVKARFLQDGR